MALVKGNMQKVGKSGRREGGEGKIISDVILIFIAFLSIINKFSSFFLSKKLKRNSSFWVYVIEGGNVPKEGKGGSSREEILSVLCFYGSYT